jgi:hypothetical protein
MRRNKSLKRGVGSPYWRGRSISFESENEAASRFQARILSQQQQGISPYPLPGWRGGLALGVVRENVRFL